MAERTFSTAFGIQHASPSFNYVFDTALGSSGLWRNVQAGDLSAPALKTTTTTYTGLFVAASGAKTLYTVQGFNSRVANYLQVYDNFNTGANLVSTTRTAGTGTFSVSFGNMGIVMNTGITVFNSTTAVTPTAAPNDLFITVIYR